MTEHNLKTTVGIFLILSHFAVIICVLVISGLGGIDFSETTTSIALIVPMFATYTTAIIRFIVEHSRDIEIKSPLVSKAYVFISFFIPTLFVVFLIVVIILRGYRIWIRDPEMYKYLLGLGETLFGVYVGLILRSMFEIRRKRN